MINHKVCDEWQGRRQTYAACLLSRILSYTIIILSSEEQKW